MNNESRSHRVYRLLCELGISFSVVDHPPVFTIEEAEKHWNAMSGAHCKNLFLRNKKGNHHFLLIIRSTSNADLKALTEALEEDRLSFASAERLMKYLGLEQGAVSPFGLINDVKREVEVIIDRELAGEERVNFHPNENTVTVGISYGDFLRFLSHCGNRVRYITL